MTVLMHSGGPRAARAAASRAEVLTIVCAGVVLASLDLFIVNVALPQIARELHTSNLGELSWLLNAYAIVYASLLVFFGRLADRYRRDRAFLLGLLVAASWRWVFLVNVPIGITALVVGWRRLPALGGHPIERPDPAGVVLATAGVGLLTFGLVKGPEWGWASGRVGSVLASAGVLLLVFVWHCRHARAPLVQPELFRSREFTVASIIAVFFSAAFGAMLLSIVLWEQGAWGWSALRAGLAIAPGPLMVPVMSFLAAGRLIRRYGAAVVIIAGSLTFAAGRAWWALAITPEPNYVTGVLGGMILGGVGVGLVLPTMMGTATASLPAQSFATGSGVINMIRQTGLALGVALLVAVLGTGAGHSTARLATFDQGWWLTAALAFAGLIPALALLQRARPTLAAPGALTPPVEEI